MSGSESGAAAIAAAAAGSSSLLQPLTAAPPLLLQPSPQQQQPPTITCHCGCPCRRLLTISVRSYTLLKIVLFLALAFSALYYAFWVSALQRDPIPLTNAELWPTILMLVAFPFMTRWETSLADGHARFSTAFSSYRSGGLMSPTSCRIIVGGGLAFGGAMWQCGIVLHRYLLPLPNQPRAPSTWPGILLLAELVLIVCAAYNVFLYVSFVSTSNATLNDDDDGEDDV